MEIEVKIDGLRELEARLVELGGLAGRRALTSAMRSAAKPMVAAASRNARGDDSGALAASIAAFNIKRLGGGDTVAKIGVGPVTKNRVATFVHNSFYRRRRKGVFYGHLVEYGHRIGTRKTGWLQKLNRRAGAGGASGGSVPPRPFLRPAFSATANEFLTLFRKRVAQAVKRIERRKGLRAANPDVTVTP